MYTCIMPLDARHRRQGWNVQVLFNYQKKKKKKKLGKKKKTANSFTPTEVWVNSN